MAERDHQKHLEAIKNAELRGLVEKAIRQKYDKTPYLLPNGARISMHIDPIKNPLWAVRVYSNNKAFCDRLINWAINPESDESGIQGLGFSLLLAETLSHYVSKSGLTVVQSPAKLDFLKSLGSDTVDIVIAKREGRVVKPEILIEAKMSTKEDARLLTGKSKLLRNMPVIRLRGDSLLRNTRATVLSFAKSDAPSNFAHSLSVNLYGRLDALIKNI